MIEGEKSSSSSESEISYQKKYENPFNNEFNEDESSLYSYPSPECHEILSNEDSDSLLDIGNISTENPKVNDIKKQTKKLKAYVKSKINDIKIEPSGFPNTTQNNNRIQLGSLHEYNDHSVSAAESQIMDQLRNLQRDVQTMNHRLSTREEILKGKERENKELKEAIKRLEQNINQLAATTATDFSDHEDEKIVCSCTNKCLII
ncbi:unnamed protein product [Blepharisma stoltei]|uniref:Uncharacterized protein n=1 Tax=Blepharisma stoltei TaxID=1481888 RepID=A0AAU9JQX1_9CILI|nr:unnamed protein product [Blepharisma stoltei]